MTYQKILYYTDNRIPLSLKNLCGFDHSVVDIEDAIEEAKDVDDLLVKLFNMRLLRRIFFDKENESRIRLKCLDCFGNVSYLEIKK